MLCIRSRGAALVETALLAPLAALFSFAVLNLFLLAISQLQLERMVAFLARHAAVHYLTSPADVEAAVRAWLDERHLDDITPDVRIKHLSFKPMSGRERGGIPIVEIRIERKTKAVFFPSFFSGMTQTACAREAVL